MKQNIILLLFIFILSGCSYFDTGEIQNVGLLVDTAIDENAWSKKGYNGLLLIEERFDVQVYYKENITSEEEINEAVDELVQDGVNLIFGHSNIYGDYFIDIAELYPDVHFVYVNGGETSENVTSLNFNSHAMGFFAGMVAGKMTATNEIGVIAAFSWQSEAEGFYEGVKYQNPDAHIRINYTNSWTNIDIATGIYKTMQQNGVDIVYPIGDSYSDEIIRKAAADQNYAIGYITDQLSIAPDTVLTSTIQHVDELYEITAEQFNEGKLAGELLTFDFQDEFITLGEFNDAIPETFQVEINDLIKEYKETGLLPNEQ
ncbi:BMP family ABC transporter substrate-binding protein [Oceanobacillus sp. FSL K6-2867]|uniref:BMP family ABC transporter substrate-binding protein n=1 Tax=Oceanobacillus sp. FSL K6-2867 TaxID=2954748 RepID=UPI0030DC3740